MIVVILVLCYTLLYIRYLNFSSYDIEEQTYSDYRVAPILKKSILPLQFAILVSQNVSRILCISSLLALTVLC